MMRQPSRIAQVIDATLFGIFLSFLIDLPMPRPLVAALSFVSVLFAFVGLDALSAFQKRRVERGRLRTPETMQRPEL